MYNNGYDPMMEYYDDPSMGMSMNNGYPSMVQNGMQSEYWFDESYLLSVGFDPQAINAYKIIMAQNGKFNRGIAANYGLAFQEVDQLAYLHSFCQGKVSLEGIDNVVKHRRKLNKYGKRVSIQDLKISNVREVPRVAIIYGIPSKSPFAIYNSNNYKGMKMIYRVLNVTSKNIIVETSRIPALKYSEALKIDDIIEITERKDKKDGGSVLTLSVSKDHCRLCNRYLIVASLKRPEFHLGMYTMVCYDGTKLYIFAKSIGIKTSMGYNQSSQRIYQYGIFRKTIESKLNIVGTQLYNKFQGVYFEYDAPNDDYTEIDRVRKDTDVDDEVMNAVE